MQHDDARLPERASSDVDLIFGACISGKSTNILQGRSNNLSENGFIHDGDTVETGVIFSSWVFSSLFSCVAWVQESGFEVNEDPTEKLKDNVEDLGNTLNEFSGVQEASAGILEPIYQLAEFMAFPAFYWVAFALMVAGVVSFAGQLVFSKFFLLFKMNLNVKEILADALGLLISLVGLVLTTQAATQNSGFPDNAIAVVSATAVGAIVGLVFYWWGQTMEFQAARKTEKPQS